MRFSTFQILRVELLNRVPTGRGNLKLLKSLHSGGLSASVEASPAHGVVALLYHILEDLNSVYASTEAAFAYNDVQNEYVLRLYIPIAKARGFPPFSVNLFIM